MATHRIQINEGNIYAKMSLSKQNWSNLPHHILKSIFLYLGDSALIASGTCYQWRRVVYSCKQIWKNLKVDASHYEKIRKPNIGISPLLICENIAIEFNPLLSKNVKNACHILCCLKFNRYLRSISIKPSSSYIEWFDYPDGNWCSADSLLTVRDFCSTLANVIQSVNNLEHLSWGLTDGFDGWQNFLLESLKSSQLHCLHSLHIATLRSDPSNDCVAFVDKSLLASFDLTHLSLDYVHLSDDLLMEISRNCSDLRRLSLFVHQWSIEMPYIRNQIWRHLAHTYPSLNVAVNIIHADQGLSYLCSRVLQPGIPLDRLRLYFCQALPSTDNLHYLGITFGKTLRSLHLVDSLLESQEPNFYKSPDDLSPDPFVMLTWRCKVLEDFTLTGYWMNISDLKALSALRGPTLKKLRVPECCIHFDECDTFELRKEYLHEISMNLGYEWKPCSDQDLSPAVLNMDWDSEEDYLPFLLSEQEPEFQFRKCSMLPFSSVSLN